MHNMMKKLNYLTPQFQGELELEAGSQIVLPMKLGRKSKFSVASLAKRFVFYNPSIFETFLIKNFINYHGLNVRFDSWQFSV